MGAPMLHIMPQRPISNKSLKECLIAKISRRVNVLSRRSERIICTNLCIYSMGGDTNLKGTSRPIVRYLHKTGDTQNQNSVMLHCIRLIFLRERTYKIDAL